MTPPRTTTTTATLLCTLFLMTPAFAQEPPLPAVLTAPVKVEMLAPTRPLQATVVPAREAALAARDEGQVAWVASLGSVVEAGAELARLDDAEARLGVARERARIERLKTELELADRQLQRVLGAGDAIPAAQRDEAVARRAVLAAQTSEARVALQSAELALRQTRIQAPFAGVVSAELRQVGERVRAGEAVLRLSDTRRPELELAVPVELATHASTGTELALEGLGLNLRARVQALVPGSAETRQLRARLVFDQDQNLPTGAALSVAWPTAPPALAVTVPADALIHRPEGLHLLRMDEDRVHLVTVEIAQRVGQRVAIRGQIGAGDVVVIRGGERVADGSRVRILTDNVLAGGSNSPAGG